MDAILTCPMPMFDSGAVPYSFNPVVWVIAKPEISCPVNMCRFLLMLVVQKLCASADIGWRIKHRGPISWSMKRKDKVDKNKSCNRTAKFANIIWTLSKQVSRFWSWFWDFNVRCCVIWGEMFGDDRHAKSFHMFANKLDYTRTQTWLYKATLSIKLVDPWKETH